MNSKTAVLGLLALFATLGNARDSSGATTETRLVSSTSKVGDHFGTAVAVDGDTAVVVEPINDFDNGFVHVFEKSGGNWTEKAKFAAFGNIYAYDAPVAISGDTIVVGAVAANFSGDLAGSAHVFVRDAGGWTEQQKLTSDSGAVNDNFGASVGVSGDTIVVGASGAGAAYVFVRSGATWTQQQKLSASDAGNFDSFGKSVGVSAAAADAFPTVVVGSPFHGDAGFAYVFARSGTTWSEQGRFTDLGWSVAVSGETLVIGSPRAADAGSESGSARVFVRTGAAWNEQTTLAASDAHAGDHFGASVGIRGDSVVVGSPHDGSPSDSSGACYAFSRTDATWSAPLRFTTAVSAARRGFGRSVGVGGGAVVVGTGDSDHPGVAGSAFLFDLTGSAGGGNTPPGFALPVVASANPVVAGKTVTFATLATDADKGDRISYGWHFGDGTTAVTKTKPAAAKTYATPGSYDVFVRATDRAGASADSKTTTIVVEPTGTPYFDVSKATAALNFKKVGKDAINVSGQFPLADGTALEGKVLAFDFGGVARSFALDAKGRTEKGPVTARVVTGKGGVAKFTVTLTGSFGVALAASGLTNETTKNVVATIHVAVTFDGTPYAEDHVMIYAGKAGKTGSAK